MSPTRKPATLAWCALAIVAVAWPIGAWAASAPDSPDAREAARLVTRTRDAASRYDYSGTAVITWTVGDATRQAEVEVHDVDGVLEIVAADGGAVIDEGRRTYLRDRLGWTGALVEPAAANLPDPSHEWALSLGPPRTVAGRPTTAVVAARADGTPAQRLFVDDATGLLLGRQVLGPSGHVQRSMQFVTVDIGDGNGQVQAPRGVETEKAKVLSSVPDGYRAPSSLAGYELVTRSEHPDGVLLFYSDGLFTASVFEQQGDLDWSALPSGGSESRLAGTRTRMYHDPSGDVVVWARHGLVYTGVSDAPSDVFADMIEQLADSGRSTPESIVDYVLGPFGWN
jgi:sigma-E factor negative regulatory protein RseB